MKYRGSLSWLVALLALLLVPDLSWAADAPTAPPSTPPPAATPPKKPAPLRYKAPAMLEGKTGDRISGGTRGVTGPKLPFLDVLAPDHIALTSQAQPALFWFLSAPAKAGFEIAVTELDKAKPLLKTGVDTAKDAGIHALSLARQNVTLQPGVTYRWSVALVPDQPNRSKDVVASGKIKRVAPPAGLEEKLAGAGPAERASIYAAAGFWYDALQAISAAIAAEPKNRDLRDRRAGLLKDAGLKEAAEADRR